MTKKKEPAKESPAKVGKRRQKSPGKAMRDESIFADAAKGLNNNEISKKYSISRQRVSEILNSPDAKARADEIQKEVIAMVPLALKTLFDSIQIGDYLAARDVLRSTGALLDLKKIEVSGPKGGPIPVSSEVKGTVELKLSLEERVKMLKGET